MSDEHKTEVMPVTDFSTIPGMFQNYYLDYASYVILERAIPSILDGLKPVQRRILHAMHELDDGRFHKIANVIGNTMRFHPHGDAAIGEAITNLGQKDLLLETQGNWGNVHTGDAAAAPRYIEGKLSKFAKEVLFQPALTEWTPSYDGRAQEPVALPVKFPLVLQLGTDGIAVGLSTKILPHNFRELAEACIAALKEKPFELYPDFPTGGLIDVSDYNDGRRGGRIRVRARMEIVSAKLIRISAIPFGTTTTALIESILAASEKGKIKVKKVDDNTAKTVEILIHLPPDATPEQTIDALYAFTSCEESLSPNCCVIQDGRPVFPGVSEVLRACAFRTRDLLEKELQLRRDNLKEKIFSSTLERIFIEEKIYRHIENCETWEAVLETLAAKLAPYADQLARPVTGEDLISLTEIRIKRISKHDKQKTDHALARLQEELAEVERDLLQMTRYAIAYFKRLLRDFGTGHERRSELANFRAVRKLDVAVQNVKLFANMAEGFIGSGLRKDQFVTTCSDLDEIICINSAGQCRIVKVAEKLFVAKDLIHVGIYRRGDEESIYNFIYWDEERKISMVKRCTIPSITRDKTYDLFKLGGKARVQFFAVQSGETDPMRVVVRIKAAGRRKPEEMPLNLADFALRARDAAGVQLTAHPVVEVEREGGGPEAVSE